VSEPTTDELNDAVAGVLNLQWHHSIGMRNIWTTVCNGVRCTTDYKSDVHLDWNALMVAVGKLESAGVLFKRHGAVDENCGEWLAFDCLEDWMQEYPARGFQEFDTHEQEARALALCIHAVTNLG
jgi:hypothetical protein